MGMRILIGHNYYRSSSPSGENTVVGNEVALLTAAGAEVHLIERFNDNIDDSSFKAKLGVAFSTAWSAQSYKETLRVLAEVKPDVAHFHNTFPLLSPSVYAACRKKGVPVVQTIHNFRNFCPAGLLFREGRICEECIGRMPFPALKHRCYRSSLVATVPVAWMVARNRLLKINNRMIDRFIVPTRFVADKLVVGGFQEEKICVKPHFLPDPPDTGEGKGGYAIYAGRLSAEKGVRTLLDAWRYVEPPIPLYIVGDGELRGELEARVRDERLNVKFLGMQSHIDVMKLIQDACFLIVPSECYETFGMTVIEAYACGTPVIVSDIGGLAENVLNGKTGWVVRPGDSEELANVINSTGIGSDLIQEFRKNCRKYFDERFAADSNLNSLMEIYSQVIKSPRDWPDNRFM